MPASALAKKRPTGINAFALFMSFDIRYEKKFGGDYSMKFRRNPTLFR